MNKINKLTGVMLIATIGISGCQQYLDRREGLTGHSGNTLAANEAKMVVDPWPRYVENTDISVDGKRMSDAAAKSRNTHATDTSATQGKGSIGNLFDAMVARQK